ncbi:MAG: hypothetical protein JXB03_07315 [Spirochaetales bacterium]|nr:hypothetical protein [Spirochaetales bacterium]
MKHTGTITQMLRIMTLLAVAIASVSCAGPEGDFTRFSKLVREFPKTGEGWMTAAENDRLILDIHKQNAAVRVTDRISGKEWYSNPQEDDPAAAGINKDILKSQFRITYFNDSSVKKTMNSYGFAVEKGQFSIEKTKTGAAVTYTLGNIDHIQLIPKIISKERYEYFYEKMGDRKYTAQMDRQYQMISLEKALSEETRQEYLAKYPQLERYDIYKFPDNLTNKALLARIEEGFIAAGYTLEDLMKDNADNMVAGEKPNIELFTITLQYDIDGGVFHVRIPTDGVLYHPSFPITSIRLFEFFGAAKADMHDGYMFIPDGSGALIDLDNGKKWADNYYAFIYDEDPAVPRKETGMKQLGVTMPVFGMKQDDNAFLAVIEEGDAHANLYADISGKVNSYNNVCSEYTFLGFSPVTLESLQGNKYVNTYQQAPFDGEIRVGYYFLNGQDADYAGMAKTYSRVLFGTTKQTQPRAQLALDIVMAIDLKKQFLGVPYNGIEPVTTYAQTRNILEDVHASGVERSAVTLLGWQKGGINHDPSFKRNSKVGPADDMMELIRFSEEKGTYLFFDGSVTRVLRDKAFDGYSRNFHTVKLLDRKDAVVYPWSIATRTPDKLQPPNFLVSPVRGSHVYDKAAKQVARYGLPGFAFRFAGNALHGDYFERNEVARQNAIPYMNDLFSGMNDKGARVLLRGGNAYALDDAFMITDTELDSSGYFIADRSVPFVAMVLSGKRQFAGKAVNLNDSSRRTFLKHVESGAIPHFTVMAADNSIIVNTFHDNLFSVHYPTWAGTIKEWSEELSSVRSAAGGSPLVGHAYLSDDVVVSEYANGVQIIINYGSTVFTYGDLQISGEDYAIVR